MTARKTKKTETEIVPTTDSNIVNRTPDVIAAEIRSIDQQAREFVLRSAVEIGKRLIEAKELVKHGEWGKWLEQHVNYKQSTANNFMRIASEYADSSSAIANLTYSQAVALLSLPAEEREEFAEQNNVKEMSTRELQQAIKDKQELERKLKEEQERLEAEKARAEEEKKKREELYEHYQKELELRKKQEEQLLVLQEKAGDDSALKEAKAKLAESAKRIKELEKELKSKPIDIPAKEIVEVIPDETKKELEALRQREELAAKQISEMQQLLEKNNNTAAIKVKICFDNLVENFKSLLAAVNEVQNEEEKAKFQGAVSKLCDKMKEQL
ncbi:DUF3102 domain-containing protein [Paenibacillus sp. 32O-W]|uniref:DUF3102 domain-containing protein n=1 Tax=Paenibacillus sp. 32O-W TaxID=1695218 RepID=UPI0011A400E3|nr:DUF3102 domain-containing protein [Paenibacillus sp. 32O-W]